MEQSRLLFWNDKDMYELKMRQMAMESLKYKECKMWMVSTLDNFMSEFTVERTIQAIRSKQFDVHAVVRRDEHGKLWGRQAAWSGMIKACHEMNIKTLYFDFGYLDHYGTFMFDAYDTNGESSIYLDWPNISDKLDWDTTPEYIQKYRNKFLKLLNKAKKEKPINNLKEGEYVVIWPQYSMDLVRPAFKEGLERKSEVTDWVNKMCELVRGQGLTPVVKGGPAMEHWFRLKVEDIKHATVYVHSEKQLSDIPSAKFEKDVNHKLIAHAKYHIVSCSSVTNELVLAGAPVIATGESWFTGLNIFNEPKDWNSVMDDPMYINQPNRNRWINWWLSRQVQKADGVKKLLEIFNKYPVLKV